MDCLHRNGRGQREEQQRLRYLDSAGRRRRTSAADAFSQKRHARPAGLPTAGRSPLFQRATDPPRCISCRRMAASPKRSHKSQRKPTEFFSVRTAKICCFTPRYIPSAIPATLRKHSTAMLPERKRLIDSKVKAHIATRLLFRHWDSWKEGKRSHLFVVPANGSRPPRDLTPGDYDTPPFSLGGPDNYAFSPDGTEVCFASNHDAQEERSTNVDLFTVNLLTGETRKITTNPAYDGSPLYSPNGKFIAYRAQFRAGYESDRFRLMLYDRATGQHRNLTESFDRWIDSFAWAPDSRKLYFHCRRQRAQQHFRNIG